MAQRKIGMPAVDVDMTSRQGIPHLYRPVAAARSDTFTIGSIGRPRHRQHIRGMAAIGVHIAHRGDIPDLHRKVGVADGQVSPVSRPSCRVYNTAVVAIIGNALSSLSIQHLSATVAADSDTFA